MPKLLHSQGTWKLAKCSVYVRNGYDGQSEIVSELARHTALKRWIATKILWYRNAASRRSTVQRVDLLPISVRKCWASSARGPSVSIASIIVLLVLLWFQNCLILYYMAWNIMGCQT